MSKTDELVGKTIIGIDVDANEEAIRFRIEDGEPIVWAVEGECCSHSYWHDGYSLNALRDAEVIAVATLDLPDPEDQLDEYIQAYGYAITTSKGATTLAFRNSSNGYYGGYCYGTMDSDRFRWREITANDWQAGGPNDPPIYTPEELAAQAFRTKVESGLHSCRQELSKVVPVVPAYGDYGSPTLVDVVLSVQDKRTADILVLGVYLTRMAEHTLLANAVEQPA